MSLPRITHSKSPESVAVWWCVEVPPKLAIYHDFPKPIQNLSKTYIKTYPKPIQSRTFSEFIRSSFYFCAGRWCQDSGRRPPPGAVLDSQPKKEIIFCQFSRFKNLLFFGRFFGRFWPFAQNREVFHGILFLMPYLGLFRFRGL